MAPHPQAADTTADPKPSAHATTRALGLKRPAMSHTPHLCHPPPPGLPHQPLPPSQQLSSPTLSQCSPLEEAPSLFPLLTSLASGSAASSLGGGGPALLPGPPAPAAPSARGSSSSCSRLSWSGELHLELNSGESGRRGGLGGRAGKDGEGEYEAGVGGPSTGVWGAP